MARQLGYEMCDEIEATQNAQVALMNLINCGKTLESSRAAVQALVSGDFEGERLLAIFEKLFGLALVPIEMIEAL
jgi:hypothetical protein